MPTITCTISTTEEEQARVYEAIKTIIQTVPSDKPISLSTIALEARINQNRVRYIIDDLVVAGKISRVPTKAFNRHYIRYRYELS